MRAARLARIMPVSTQKTLMSTAAKPIDMKNMKTLGDCTNASWKSRGSSRMSWDAISGANAAASAKLTI